MRFQIRSGEGSIAAGGALFWTACVQYFFAEAFVAHFAVSTYSPLRNVISDLGAVGCTSALCSPTHGWMNASFCLQGVLIVVGAVLLRRAVARSRLSLIAVICFVLSGLGVLVVGLAPEDVSPVAHYVGAAAHFVCGGAGMLLLGIAAYCAGIARRKAFAAISIACGMLTLTNTALLGMHFSVIYVGAVERAAAYPYTAWLVGAGIYFLHDSYTGAYRSK